MGRIRPSGASYGFTLPLGDIPLAEHAGAVRELTDAGYSHAWAGEADGLDAVVPLAAAAAWAPGLHVGTAIVPAFTRGPAVLAMTAAALAELAPERAALGIGPSSPVIVRNWNGIDYAMPRQRVVDALDFVRRATAGERITARYESFDVSGFRLARVPARPPQLLVAALRPGMLELAATAADGAITTWAGTEHITQVAGTLQRAAPAGVTPRLVAWITVCPDEDADIVRERARPMIAAYLNVPGYAAFHRWLGNERLLEPVWAAWDAGDRKGAVAAVSDELVDQLIVHGPAGHCREVLDAYIAAGVTDLALHAQIGTPDPVRALLALAPD